MQSEGKSVLGKEISWMIKDSIWWRERQEKERQNQALSPAKTAATSQSKAAPSPLKTLAKSSPAAKGVLLFLFLFLYLCILLLEERMHLSKFSYPFGGISRYLNSLRHTPMW